MTHDLSLTTSVIGGGDRESETAPDLILRYTTMRKFTSTLRGARALPLRTHSGFLSPEQAAGSYAYAASV